MPTHPNSQALAKLLANRLAKSPQRRVTFAEYMDLVLYHPQYGYYAWREDQIGGLGDFFTSSSLGKDFGELLAIQFVKIWEIMGRPKPFTIIEIGAGTGAMAVDILQYLAKHHLHLFSVTNYTIVEQSNALKKRQKREQESSTVELPNLSWKSWEEIPDDSIVGCLFSNELVDAFPVHLVTASNNKLQEIYVTISAGKLTEVIGELSTSKIPEYFKLIEMDFPSFSYPNGYRTEVNLAALTWLETVVSKLKRGYLFTIDYGYPAAKYYHPQRYQGTLQCYHRHRRNYNPYINLGVQDITAHVNFTALERYGEKLGLARLGFTQQGIFLMKLGLGDRLSDLSSGKYNLRETLQRRDSLQQLIHPGGLGGFGVLAQAKGISNRERAKFPRW